jgi:hypothetical protein
MKNWNLIKTAVSAFVLLHSVVILQAQKLPMKFGNIESAQFDIKAYDKDTSAEALILGDYGESAIFLDQNDGFVLEYSRHFRAKIFKKTAYDLANQHLFLHNSASGKERVVTLKGTVYNMEKGKIVESDLEKTMILEEKIDNKTKEMKFTLPNVREGSIIEFYYKVRSDFMSIPDWQFQHTIPALWSEYRVTYPEYFVFKKLQKGYLAFDVSENSMKPFSMTIRETTRSEGWVATSTTESYQIKYEENFFRWVKNDVPAFREEPYMNALVNYQSAIEFELSAYAPPRGLVNNFSMTWEKINQEMLDDEDFGLQIKRGGFLKDVVAQVKGSGNDPVKQMISAYNFVRSNMKWDRRNRVYVTTSLRNAFDKKSGSSADINLMLVALLKELGMESNPVILSTRNNGLIHPAQIMISQFNYVIASVKIGDKTYLLDATEKSGAYNLLPARCINGQGRIITEVNPDWIDLNPATRYEYTNVIKASIGSDGMITGNMQRSFGNYAALDKRSEVQEKNSQDEYVRSLESSHKGLSVSKFELIGIDSLSKPFKENLDVEVSDYAQPTGNIIALTPLLFDQWETNPFKLEDRKFPVDFTYPQLYRDIINYTIPDGYTLDEKPADLIVAMPDGKTRFTYRMRVDGNQLQISSTLDIGRALYTYDEYAILKEFFSKVVTKQAEKVVFKKST